MEATVAVITFNGVGSSRDRVRTGATGTQWHGQLDSSREDVGSSRGEGRVDIYICIYI